MDYYQKYIKYKIKYLKLVENIKDSHGGASVLTRVQDAVKTAKRVQDAAKRVQDAANNSKILNVVKDLATSMEGQKIIKDLTGIPKRDQRAMTASILENPTTSTNKNSPTNKNSSKSVDCPPCVCENSK